MEVSVTYFEAGASLAATLASIPRVAVGMVHTNLAEATIGSQVSKIIEMDDIIGAVNPVTKILLIRRPAAAPESGEGNGGAAGSEAPQPTLQDLDALHSDDPEVAARDIAVVVYRRQEGLSADKFAMEMTLRVTAAKVESFAPRPNQCLRVLESRRTPGGHVQQILRRVWPGDDITSTCGDGEAIGSDGSRLVTLVLESIPTAAQVRVIPTEVFEQFTLSAACDPAAVFSGVVMDDVAALDKQRAFGWRGFATPCGRASYMKNSNLKEAVRLGVPSSRRADVQRDVIGIYDESHSGRTKQHFDDVIRGVFRFSKDAPLPKMFEPRFPPHFDGDLHDVRARFGLNTEGIREMKLVLCALGELHQDITSSPLAVPLTCIMLQYLPAHDVFAALHKMIASSRHKNIADRLYFLRISLLEHVSQAVVSARLVRSRFPRIAAVFDGVGVSLSRTILDTINSFFANVFPAPYIWRLVDSFVNEGHKVIIRFVLSLIKHLELRIYNCASSADLEALFNRDSPQGCFKTISQQNFTLVANFAFSMSLARQEVEDLELASRDESEELARTVTESVQHPLCLRQRPELLPPMALPSSALEPLFMWCGASSGSTGVRSKWSRLFSAAVDGWSLQSLYRLCGERVSSQADDGRPRFVIIAQLANNDRFSIVGAALTACPSFPTGKKYRGSDACFAFTLGLREDKFAASGANQYYLLCESSHLTIGGSVSASTEREGESAEEGSDGTLPSPMLRLNEDLQTGVSYACPTFESPSFAARDDGYALVQIAALDVYEIV